MIPRFRAWHNELGRMMSIKNMWFQDSRIEELELNDAVMNDHITAYPDEIELMQSTGIKDKNGKEIFEGDIVRQVRTQPTTENKTITGGVTMLEGAWVIMNDCEQLASYLWSETDENEVLGNIYETPELLEVDNED